MNLKITAVILLVSVLVVRTKSGFLLTFPRNLIKNTVNTLYFQLHQVDDPGKIQIELSTSKIRNYEIERKVFASQEYDIPQGTVQKEIEFFVPKVEGSEGYLKIEGNFGNNYTLHGKRLVNFKDPMGNIIFVQTDRPFYKPGDEVKFRVLLVDGNLKPLGGNVEGEIWIEDPKGSRMAQWQGIPLGNGIRQLQFPLSDEPNLGMWTINTNAGDVKKTAMFEVKEYVLPKFEITITTPPYVMRDDEKIPIEICAKYTYGKAVEGTLKMNISEKSLRDDIYFNPTVEVETKLNGCYNYNLIVSSFEKLRRDRRKIFVSVLVVEDGTGVAYKKTKYIERSNKLLKCKFDVGFFTNYFKPGLPYFGKVKVTTPDDSGSPEEPVDICLEVFLKTFVQNLSWHDTHSVMSTCKTFVSDEQGEIEFAIPPMNTNVIKLHLKCGAKRMMENPIIPDNWQRKSMSVKPWMSPSESFIQIQQKQKEIPCNQVETFKVLFTTKDERGTYNFYYQISVRGKVILQGTVSKTFTLEEDISSNYTEKSISKRIVLPPSRFAHLEARNGHHMYEIDIDVTVTTEMSPNFQFLVYYVRDMEIVADVQRVTVEQCFNNKVDFEFGDEVKQPGTKTSLKIEASPNSLCGVKVVDKSVSLMNSRNQLTKVEVFRGLQNTDSGIYDEIDYCSWQRIRRPWHNHHGKYVPNPESANTDSLEAFHVFGYLAISDINLLSRTCTDNFSPSLVEHEPYVIRRRPNIVTKLAGGIPYARRRPQMKDYPPLHAPPRQPPPKKPPPIDEGKTKSAVEVRNYFPETWLFDMHMIDSSGKLEWKETLPHTITEWLGNAVCIHKQDGLGISDERRMKGFQDFFISLSLPYSLVRGEKTTVTAKVFNYLDQSLPISLWIEESTSFTNTSSTEDVCLAGGTTHNLPITIQATDLGKLNITVRASTKDGVCGETLVHPRIARDAVTRSVLVKPEGVPQEDVTSVLFCPKNAENGIYEQNLVFFLPENLVPNSARAYIQITGNGMGPAVDNLDSLVVLPTGCGEQNIVKFTPNVVVLDYLTAIGKLNDELKTKAIDNLNKGAQREMNYRHPDGSFSAFGTRDHEGSIILTAFVVRSFAQASKYIIIDETKFKETLIWVISKQRQDGCFPDIGQTFDSQLKGGIINDQGLITAYVLSSLMIAGMKDESVINSAFRCMEDNEKKMTSYKASLYAYTSALAQNSASVDKYMSILRSKAETSREGTRFRNAHRSLSLDIQTAAYAVLTIMKSDKIWEALDIVRWMTQHRNPRGGFISTQDTVLGLEALGEVETRLNRDSIELSITTSGNASLKFNISEDDKLLMREYKIPNIPSEIHFQAEGSGCGLMQTILRYNTISPATKPSFALEISGECNDPECKIAKISINVGYLAQKNSNMVLLEVNMISGMIPDENSLSQLMTDMNLGLMKYEIESEKVVFYFYQLTSLGKHLEFYVKEDFHVENRQSAIAKVYDYYAKENSATASYSLVQ